MALEELAPVVIVCTFIFLVFITITVGVLLTKNDVIQISDENTNEGNAEYDYLKKIS